MQFEPDPKVVAEQERRKQAMLQRARARQSNLLKGEPLVLDEEEGVYSRSSNNLWLVCQLLETSCPKLPHELNRCASCGHRFQPAEGWAWVEPGFLFGAEPCEGANYWQRRGAGCSGCPMGTAVPERAGLYWTSGSFAIGKDQWNRTTKEGRMVFPIDAMPEPAIEPGFTWCFLAGDRDGQGKRFEDPDSMSREIYRIWGAVMVTRVEYILGYFDGEEYTGDMLEAEELQQLVNQGLTPVIIDLTPKEGGPEAARGNGV